MFFKFTHINERTLVQLEATSLDFDVQTRSKSLRQEQDEFYNERV
jgi:hypothetical protein